MDNREFVLVEEDIISRVLRGKIEMAGRLTQLVFPPVWGLRPHTDPGIPSTFPSRVNCWFGLIAHQAPAAKVSVLRLGCLLGLLEPRLVRGGVY